MTEDKERQTDMALAPEEKGMSKDEKAKPGDEKAWLKKRLICYLIVTFALTWIPMFLFLGLGGKYDSNQPETALLCMYAMLCPAAAVLITRKLTKEGFAATGKDSLLLGIRFADGKWFWYLMAFGYPLLYMIIADTLWFVLVPGSFDPSMPERSGLSLMSMLYIPLCGMINAVAVSFGALGEELGWRTYLYPKLEELFGLKKALILGGLIWSVWHFPLVAVGHVGTGYWGEPYTGFLLFTIDTAFMGCVAYLVVKKTDSVWPAVFLHAFYNTGSSILVPFMNEEKATGIFRDGAVRLAVLAVGSCVIGLFACRLLQKMKPEAQKR